MSIDIGVALALTRPNETKAHMITAASTTYSSLVAAYTVGRSAGSQESRYHSLVYFLLPSLRQLCSSGDFVNDDVSMKKQNEE